MKRQAVVKEEENLKEKVDVNQENLKEDEKENVQRKNAEKDAVEEDVVSALFPVLFLK